MKRVERRHRWLQLARSALSIGLTGAVLVGCSCEESSSEAKDQAGAAGEGVTGGRASQDAGKRPDASQSEGGTEGADPEGTGGRKAQQPQPGSSGSTSDAAGAGGTGGRASPPTAGAADIPGTTGGSGQAAGGTGNAAGTSAQATGGVGPATGGSPGEAGSSGDAGGGGLPPVDGQCEDGYGLYEPDGACWPCFDGVPRPTTCVGVGETGRVMATDAAEDADCICETKDEYYVASSATRAVPCDADGDGWVTDSAQPQIEGDNEVRRDNARCTVQYVHAVELQGDLAIDTPQGTFRETLDVSNSLGLPLYEEARNDTATSIGGYGLEPRVVSSLTKGCSVLQDDFNRNGISDVRETPSSSITRELNTTLAEYYRLYTRFSYFMELHEGRLEGGVYFIRERLRADFDGWYPPTVDPYWKECRRHIDVLHADGQSGPGGDFADFGEAWGGMLHHSQFKCVQLVTASSGGSGALEQVYLTGDTDPVMSTPMLGDHAGQPRRWALSQCTAAAASAAATTVPFACPAITDPDALGLGEVYWAAVGYENAARTQTDYVRGCINECTEIGMSECDRNPEGLSESDRWVCQDAKNDVFGDAVCGCGMHYYGGNCEIGCPNDELFVETVSPGDPSTRNRDGYWMCASMTASVATPLTGGDYVLRGFVPVTGTVGELSGGDYTLTPAPAGNPTVLEVAP